MSARIIKAMQTRVQDRPSATAVHAKCEVIGSLLRPPYPAESRRRPEQGELNDVDFKSREGRAVEETIDTQTSARITIITDAAMRRYAVAAHPIDSVDAS